MNSADAWHESNEGIDPASLPATYWPADPNGDMAPILEASVEAAKQRHPSAQPAPDDGVADVLTAADRCDAGCGAGALYRVRRALNGVVRRLAFCHHHHGRLSSALEGEGWTIDGRNASLYAELYGGRNRHQGDDH